MPDLPEKQRSALASLVAEVRRRRVHRTAGPYLLGALGVIASAGDVLDRLSAPPAVAKWLTILVIAGFPVVVAVAWVYDLRVSRDPGGVGAGSLAGRRRGALILLAGIAVGMGLLGMVAFLTRERAVSASAGPPPAAPRIGVLPIELEVGEEAGWLTRALERSITDALSESRGVIVRTQDIIESYAHLPLDSLARVLGLDYAVSARLLAGETASELTLQVLDSAGTLVGSAVTLHAGPPSRAAAEELTEQARAHVLHAVGARVRTAGWRFGTHSETALNLLYAADELASQARTLLGQPGGAGVAAGVLEQADALLLKSTAADPKWSAPPLLRTRLAALKAYALLIEGAPGARVRAAMDTGVAISSELLARDPADAQALALRGMLQHRQVVYLEPAPEARRRLLAGAEEDLHAALRLDPGLALAAAELSGLLYEQARFAEASGWAERALQADAYLADADGITNRLAMATFEAGHDTAALRLCREGMRRFGTVSHHGCIIEVLAFGDLPPDVPEAWAQLERVRAEPLVAPQTRAYYEASVAAVLGRAGLRDSALRVLERARVQHRAEFATPHLQALEAAVRFRLGQQDSAAALLRGYAGSGGSDVELKLARRALAPYRPLLAPRGGR